MSYSKQRLKEVVALQKGILERIEADLQEFGITSKLKYIQEFTDEFQSFQGPAAFDDILNDACNAQVVWLSDYHVLGRSREFAAELLAGLSKRRPGRVALAVEVFYSR